jgi:hypothetical protein
MTPEVPPLAPPSSTTITTTTGPKPTPPWTLTAEKITKEMDSTKLAALVEQLCRELDAANGRGRA